MKNMNLEYAIEIYKKQNIFNDEKYEHYQKKLKIKPFLGATLYLNNK